MATSKPKQEIQRALRQLPSVDALLKLPESVGLIDDYGRSLTLEAIRHVLERKRRHILNHDKLPSPSPLPETLLIDEARAWVEAQLAPTLYPVINATGIIVHTNLGRAPLSAAATTALQAMAGGYSTLEYDVDAGARGSRSVHAEALLTRLTGTEAALVVNNNAAAVLLMLTALCQGQEVIISRGQLVEIGGGFRVPDVMVQSGATLVEVGTTNRTHLHDYAAAITPNTAAILFAHHSNYQIIGFTGEPSLAELAELAHANGIALLYDQGSGALLDVTPYGLAPEPTVPEGLAAGVDVIAFSGDKLLGGPQAGLLCGQSIYIERLKRHPLARAMRPDKLCLAALTATLGHYLRDEVTREIPVWRMLARPLEDIAAEAEEWAVRLQAQGIHAGVIDGRSRVGGGSLPGTSLATKLVAIAHDNVETLAASLRRARVPVIGRIQDNRFLLDPRTVLANQREALIEILIESCLGN